LKSQTVAVIIHQETIFEPLEITAMHQRI